MTSLEETKVETASAPANPTAKQQDDTTVAAQQEVAAAAASAPAAPATPADAEVAATWVDVDWDSLPNDGGYAGFN